MANCVAALWEDVSVLDARFLNHISWGWFVGEGVCFSGVRWGSCTRGTCQKYVLHNFLLYLTSTNLLVIQRSVGLPRMEMEIWWRKQTVKIPELFSSSFYFVHAARITRKGIAMLMNGAPSTASQSSNASVTLCSYSSNLGPDIASPEWFLCFNSISTGSFRDH
jgi:hypothetical protein